MDNAVMEKRQMEEEYWVVGMLKAELESWSCGRTTPTPKKVLLNFFQIKLNSADICP